MSEVIKLVEETIGAYLVGKRIADKTMDHTKELVVQETATKMSAVLSMILFTFTAYLMLTVLFFAIGYAAYVFFENIVLLFLIPLSLLTLSTVVFYHFRNQLLGPVIKSFIK